MAKPHHARRRVAPQRHLILPAPAQAALVAAVVILIALSCTRNAFVTLDDGLYLSNVSALGGLTLRGVAFAFTSVSALYWQPLAWLSHELDIAMFGQNPAGHHFTSVLLQALATGLLFLVLKNLGARSWLAAVGSLLWALHPLRVESFAWIAERKDVLCAFFFIATLLAYLRHAEGPSRWRYAAWNLLAALALMSKPTAVCLALTLLLLDYWPLRRNCSFVRLLTEKLPLFGMTAAVMALTVYGQKVSGSMRHLADVPLGIRIENVPIAYMRYLGKILWPRISPASMSTIAIPPQRGWSHPRWACAGEYGPDSLPAGELCGRAPTVWPRRGVGRGQVRRGGGDRRHGRVRRFPREAARSRTTHPEGHRSRSIARTGPAKPGANSCG